MPTIRQMEKALSKLQGFDNPKVNLEQYATDAHLASRMIFLLQDEYNALENSLIVDLGCGCGVLSLAASLIEPLMIYSIDLDIDALNVFKSNMTKFAESGFECDFIDIILGDALRFSNFFRLSVDTIITNPPFGTKNNAGIDVQFVKIGLEKSNRVFSLHKLTTRSFLEQKLGGKAIASMSFNIPNQFSFHRKNTAAVEVDLMHFRNGEY